MDRLIHELQMLRHEREQMLKDIEELEDICENLYEENLQLRDKLKEKLSYSDKNEIFLCEDDKGKEEEINMTID